MVGQNKILSITSNIYGKFLCINKLQDISKTRVSNKVFLSSNIRSNPILRFGFGSFWKIGFVRSFTVHMHLHTVFPQHMHEQTAKWIVKKTEINFRKVSISTFFQIKIYRALLKVIKAQRTCPVSTVAGKFVLLSS